MIMQSGIARLNNFIQSNYDIREFNDGMPYVCVFLVFAVVHNSPIHRNTAFNSIE
jgi:hypothetical protein